MTETKELRLRSRHSRTPRARHKCQERRRHPSPRAPCSRRPRTRTSLRRRRRAACHRRSEKDAAAIRARLAQTKRMPRQWRADRRPETDRHECCAAPGSNGDIRGLQMPSMSTRSSRKLATEHAVPPAGASQTKTAGTERRTHTTHDHEGASGASTTTAATESSPALSQGSTRPASSRARSHRWDGPARAATEC